MEKMISLFDEFIMKAINLTEAIINDDFSEPRKIEAFTDNRERLLSVIDQISQKIEWPLVAIETRDELYRKIKYIKSLDNQLLTKLQEHQQSMKKEIEQTFRQKENIKGYNLSDVK
jgi:hypothetical protein